MKFPHRLYVITVVAIAMLAFFGVPQAALAGELPSASYYQLPVELETHDMQRRSFASFRGRPTIVSMFYGSCPHVCPMLISTIQQVERQLDETSREKLGVLMISVDPVRDTPAALSNIVNERRIDAERWTLARTVDSADTRALAAVLDIKYKALPDGQFNHTSVLILLDAQGQPVARSSKLGQPEAAFIEAVRQQLHD